MIERKYLMHFIGTPFSSPSAYHRIGKDLEEYNVEFNPDVEVKKNIWGEQTVNHKGYEVQSEVDPYYAEKGDAFYTALESIVKERKTGDECKAKVIDLLVSVGANDAITVDWAYEEDVVVVPKSMGGDTSGYQIPFTIYYAGNRTNVTSRATVSNGALTLSNG